MTQLKYQPHGQMGYTCEVIADRGVVIRLARLDPSDYLTIAGDEALTTNRSLVHGLEAFSANEVGFRRARRADRKKAYRKSADRHESVVLGLVGLIDDVGDEEQTGYCSACLSMGQHRRVKKRMTPSASLCSECGAATTPCSVPGCDHFAIRSGRQFGLPRFCAEHVHAIPGFDKLDDRLESLDEYESWLEFDSRNAKRIITTTGGLLGGALIVGPVFLLAAPAIGGTIGAWTGLSGAAASSHGLALLGGGAVASGGLGMAGGIAVVTAAGAGLGSKLGASVASAYVANDKSFGIELVEDGVGPPVVFSSGFLTEDDHGWGDWEALIRSRYPDRLVYRLHWGAKESKDLRRIINREVSTKMGLAAAAKAAAHATRKAAARMGIVGGLFSAAELAKNPWWVAKTRADMTGAVLADLITRTETDQFVLVGHSLGARVMLQTARALSTNSSSPRLESVHLLGAAINSAVDLRNLDNAVSGTVWNYWSRDDSVLSRTYRGAQIGQRAAGAAGLKTNHPTVKNRSVSRQVKSHSDYVSKVTLQ